MTGIVRRGVDFQYVWLDVLCQADKRHTLGVAILTLAPRQQVKVGNGLHWDDYGKAVGTCKECALTGKGSDQRISRTRLEARLKALYDAGRHTGHIQV